MLRTLSIATAIALVAATAPIGQATITVGVTADDLVAAAAGLAFTGSASFAHTPGASAHGVSDTPLGTFPTVGDTYMILSTGDAALAETPNNGPGEGLGLGDFGVRGDTDNDVTILAIEFEVPVGGDCAAFDFQFFSDEYPEYVGSGYNDAFIAELDVSTWTTSGSSIIAPDNFAFDMNGSPISINAAGVAGMTAEAAAGTTYDGATPLLRTQTAVTPGTHTLYLSIFDQLDDIYDSAVFIDNLAVGAAGPDGCEGGVYIPTPPVAVAFADPAVSNIGQPFLFDGTGSFDPEEGAVSAYQWGSGATTATYEAAGTAVGELCDTLTVFDSLGASDSTQACATISDELIVDAYADKATYGLLENVQVTVEASYLDGSPVAGAATTLRVQYRSGLGPADQAFIFLGCAPYTAAGTADEDGRHVYTVPKAVFQSCLGLGGPGVVHLPTDLNGNWVFTGTATDGANSGSDSGSYDATVQETLGL